MSLLSAIVIKDEPICDEHDDTSSQIKLSAANPDPESNSSDVELKEEPVDYHTSLQMEDLYSVYKGHVVKEEMVIGPVELQESISVTEEIFTGGKKTPSTSPYVTNSEIYVCDMCGKQYSHNSSLLHHMKKVHKRTAEVNSKPRQMYKKYFKPKKAGHGRRIIKKFDRCKESPKKNKKLSCDVCNQNFQRKLSLIHHLRSHSSDTPFACDICKKTFETKENLNKHSNIHPSKESLKKLPCNLCERKFTFNSRLLHHQRIFHNGEKSFSCSVCDKTFKHKFSLTCHLRVHSGETPFACDVCNKAYAAKHALNSHYRKHTGLKLIKKVACDLCDKMFTYKSRLLDHQRTMHARKEIFSCNMCDKTFLYKVTYNSHLRYHTGEAPFECEICHKAFITSQGCSNHLRIHAGRKSYKCDICEKSFPYKNSLTVHRRIHTGEKPYTCDICKKKFSDKSGFRRHLRFHSDKKPYTCDICKQSFRLKQYIVTHIRTHTDNRPYSCGLCKKKFKTKFGASNHLHTHTEKEYVCDICDQKFTQKLRLATHIKVHMYEKQLAEDEANEIKPEAKLKTYFDCSKVQIKKEPVDEDVAIDDLYSLLHAENGVKAERVEGSYSDVNEIKDKKSSPQNHCQLCDQSFPTQSTLSLHSQTHKSLSHRAPSNIQKFICNECGRQYTNLRFLIDHKKLHTKESGASKKYVYPWSCRVCQKRFIFKSRLLEHNRIRHSNKEIFYGCHVCTKKFRSEKSLTRHVSAHDIK